MSQRAWTVAKAILIALGIGDIVFQLWFVNVLIMDRPHNPEGLFVVPFEQHGGTAYISRIDSIQHQAAFIGGLVLVLLYMIVRRLSAKRPSGQLQ